MKEEPIIYDRLSCDNCSDKSKLDFDFTMAFQPLSTAKRIKFMGMKLWFEV